MAFTITNAIDEVRGNINRDATAFPDSKIIQALTWSQTEIESFINFDEMFKTLTDTTLPNVQNRALVSDIKSIVSVLLRVDSLSLKLNFIPLREFDERFPMASTNPTQRTGRPLFYTFLDRDLLFFPVPDKLYILTIHRYRFSPDFTTSSNSTSNFLLANKFSHLLTSGATAFGFRNLREIEDADYWDKRVFQQALRSAGARQLGTKDWQKFADGFSAAGNGRRGSLFSPRDPFSTIGF